MKKNKNVIYISGPMVGVDNLNFSLFFEAETYYIQKGFDVINPARIDLSDNIYKQINEILKLDKPPIVIDKMIDNVIWIELMQKYLSLMKNSNITHILLLPNWNKSKNSIVEHFIAKNYLNAKIIKWYDKKI